MKFLFNSIPVFCFILLSLIAVNFNYIEGDDSNMIAHHLFGQNKVIQPAYSPYHSMFDVLLSFLGSAEIRLRYFAIAISLASSFFVYILIGRLLKLKRIYTHQFFLLLPFVVPEMFFSGLYINPTIVSFVFVLLSHLFLLKFLKNKNILFVVLSILFFGFGVSIRWSNGFYLTVLLAEYIIVLIESKRIKKDFIRIISFCVFAVLSVLICIQFSGYSIADIYQVYKSGSSYISSKEVSYLMKLTSMGSYMTPSFIVLLLLGLFFVFISKNWKHFLVLFMALLPFSLLGFSPSYKFMLTSFIAFLYVFAFGFSKITSQYLKVGLYLIVFAPWLLGVKLYTNTAFGPSYELKKNNLSTYKDLNNFNPDNASKVNDFEIGFFGGCALPTPEGPRPLGGFLWVLTNDYSSMVKNINDQRTNAVNFAISKNATILQDVKSCFITTKLVENGFTTNHYFTKTSRGYYTRIFTKKDFSVEIIVPYDKKQLLDVAFLKTIKSLNSQFVVYSTYTNIITKLGSSSKYNFQQKNAYWGILNL